MHSSSSASRTADLPFASHPSDARVDVSDRADAALADVLALLVGPAASPRPNQVEPLRALLAGHRVLCVQATGWGKSTVYFSAARALRDAGLGPTVVVSPLLALMRDQVDAARRAGLSAATVNSANVDDWDEVFAQLAAGTLDVLLIGPERLAAPSFAARVPNLLAAAALVVVDEAHALSDWGHDFRPDYRRVATAIATADVRVLATTATANARVCQDVATLLGEKAVTFRGTLARPSLRLHVVPGLDALDRYAWVADALSELEGTGIVYALTVAETQRLAAFLAAQGHAVQAYSSALSPDERRSAETALRAGTVKALVATSALGMGYDHPELAFVIHVGSPASPVAYYQHIGRAGRALDDAAVFLLPADSDDAIWDYFATASVPDPDQVATLLAALDALAPGDSASIAALEATTGIRRGRLEALCKLLAVDGAVARTPSGWASTATGWSFDEAHYATLVEARRAEAEVMRRYARGEGCLMRFLQQALDDPDPAPCGQCSVCTGTLPPPGPAPSVASRVVAQDFLRGLDVVLEPRKRWPNGLVAPGAPRGAIVGAAPGRALAFADDPSWATALAGHGGGRLDGPDGPLSSDLVDAVVALLARWAKTWPNRPTSVVAIPSRRHPQRVAHLASAIALVGRLPLVTALAVDGPPPPAEVASAARVSHLLETLTAIAPVPPGPVLLVDDTYRTGWTMTVAAAALRANGAEAVYPLALHQLP